MIRICFVFPSIYPYMQGEIAGGAHRQLDLLGRQLQEEFEVHFIAGDYGQDKTVEMDGFTFHRSYPPSPDTPAYKQFNQAISLFDAMRRSEADLFIHRGGVKNAVVSSSISRALSTPWMYHVAKDTDLTPTETGVNRLLHVAFSRVLKNANAVVAQTDKQARLVADRFHRNAEVIPNGYPEVEDQLSHTEREYFLWVGRIREEQKRPHLYLDLAEGLPDCDFVLVGDIERENDYAEKIKQRANSLQNVSYLGFVDPDEIHSYYRRAKAVVNTSAHEGFPSTFLESWRYDTPVISLDVDTGRFANVEDSRGYAKGNFQKLIQIVSQISDDPKERQRIVHPYGEYFTDNFTIDTVSKNYSNVIQTVLQNHDECDGI